MHFVKQQNDSDCGLASICFLDESLDPSTSYPLLKFMAGMDQDAAYPIDLLVILLSLGFSAQYSSKAPFLCPEIPRLIKMLQDNQSHISSTYTSSVDMANMLLQDKAQCFILNVNPFKIWKEKEFKKFEISEIKQKIEERKRVINREISGKPLSSKFMIYCVNIMQRAKSAMGLQGAHYVVAFDFDPMNSIFSIFEPTFGIILNVDLNTLESARDDNTDGDMITVY